MLFLNARNSCITDLSYYILRHYAEVFRNYKATVPEGVVACSFNELPFSDRVNDYCAIAFLCLHHSLSLEDNFLHLLSIFKKVIIFEPMTNPFLRFLSRFAITQRKEHLNYRPSRISAPFLSRLGAKYTLEIKTFFQMPRDYLPFISHEQREIFIEDEIQKERILSKVFFKIQVFLNMFFSRMRLGNMALIHIRQKI